jgi:ribonuclease E
MTKRMLIDATHAEETRVVVLEGNRLEDFDVETASRRQLKGNIYLAKVVRVEPSLQAAFVEYGGNRHGFLAFGEIHPDYYQIPVADRQRLLQMQEDEARAAEQADDEEDAYPHSPEEQTARDGVAEQPLTIDHDAVYDQQASDPAALAESAASNAAWNAQGEDTSQVQPAETGESAAVTSVLGADSAPEAVEPGLADQPDTGEIQAAPSDDNAQDEPSLGTRVQYVPEDVSPAPETIGGESSHADEPREPRQPSRYLRNYKIQEVIRRRQILLIQVVKEERGTKGAALTTYISLAGRFCVLMPNSPRGGGISRKITSAADRRRLKEVTSELEIPRGMGLIVRTAGAARPKPEITRDCEYLLRLWDEIRDHTMQSVAPALIYEEASLIKRAIRDVYSRDVDEILVDGEEGWKAARDFMRMLMPTHVKKVQLWRENGAPLFARQQVETQLDAMLVPTVQLKSGGYLVIDQTEALVAIDVNSGRSTRERGIEETALRTNLEAADEVARQLRLRDLAGLIVIDFIDMESKKHNAAVERRMKDALKDDRARIQLGSISHFGLMEMSRQRLRPSVAETSQSACPHCGGTGHVRSTDSAALHVLRAIEDEGSKHRAAEIMVHVAGSVAMFILNHKRVRLMEIEARTFMKVCFSPDDSLLPGQTRIDRLRALTPQDLPPPVSQTQARMDASEAFSPPTPDIVDEVDLTEEEEEDEPASPAQAGAPKAVAGGAEDTSEESQRRRRKRRRRRGGRRDEPGTANGAPMPPDAEQPDLEDIEFPGAVRVAPAAVTALTIDPDAGTADMPAGEPAEPGLALAVPGHDEAAEAAAEAGQEQGKPRTRSRRGGKRRPRPEDSEIAAVPAPYAGPTPADPFGNVADIFDILEQAEQQRIAPAPAQIQPAEKRAAPTAAEDQPAAASAAPAAYTEPASQPTGEPARPTDAAPAVEPPLPADIAAAPTPASNEPASTGPIVGPAIKPVVIGAGEAAAERKRGWWRR